MHATAGHASSTARRAAVASTQSPHRDTHVSASSTLQRAASACACGGGCPRCNSGNGAFNGLKPRGSHGPRVQAKRTVRPSSDTLEQEADRVADHVSATPTHPDIGGAPPRIQRVLGQPIGQTGAAPAPACLEQVLTGSGRPLDPALRQDMEQRFGHDFSRVRVHSGRDAEESARDLNAHAYTAGSSIVFGAGRFDPGTNDGRRLLAHELTHVVQQNGSQEAVQREPAPPVDPGVGAGVPIRPSDQLEAQLDAEDALGLKGRKRYDKNYAWSLGRKDKARIQKNWKLSPELQQEITVKFRFFEGEAKVAYLRTIGPALDEFPEETIDILAAPPSAERSCPIDQTILVYQGKPGQGRCITENDNEFRQNYIDNYIVQANGLAIPGTTWENVDHDRVPQMKLTYKDGRTLVVDVKDIPRGNSLRTPQSVGVTQSLAKYEKRSDGFIYPIRSDVRLDYVSYGDAQNIVSLGAGLYDGIEELKTGFQLVEAGAAFGADIGALGGIAALGHPGGLFEPVPRKKTSTPSKTGIDELPGSPKRSTKKQKTSLKQAGRSTQGEDARSTVSRTDEGQDGSKGAKNAKKNSGSGDETTGAKGERNLNKKTGNDGEAVAVKGRKNAKKLSVADEATEAKGGKMAERSAEISKPPAAAIDHVFNGDEFGGYHSTARGKNPNVKVVKVRLKPDANGVYKVKLEIRDPKTGKVVTKDSTMFPDAWSEGKIIAETSAVMRENSRSTPDPQGNSHAQGISPSGVVIRIDYVSGVPMSFFPIHDKNLR